ncbi:hypothetical protein KY340_03570 [Candidatus Woesearchaeota archaeon]|nr:hypothetical protein [Candidatus Woesearchaeota archaeon]
MAVAKTLEEIKEKSQRTFSLRIVSFFFALALIALGGIPLLNKYGFIGFNLELSVFILNLLLLIGGVFLLINSLRG